MPADILLRGVPTQVPEETTKAETDALLPAILKEIDDLQEMLFAAATDSLLIVLQGLDGAGKDSTIRSVFSGIDPAGLKIVAFKKPTAEEAAHDFLWRVHKEAPRLRYITVFNRSHYEEVVLPMVYDNKTSADIGGRIQAINDFETLLSRHGRTTILKVFLHVSEEYQHSRMENRRSDPKKRWKYDPADLEVIAIRDKFLSSWESIMGATEVASPWHVIPGDQKWYKRYCLAVLVRDALKAMNLRFPEGNTSNI